jgi:lysyl-tRNA synthetase class 2
MELTEQMMAAAAEAATGSTTFTYGEHEIDMTPPFKRIPLADAIFEATGIDYTKARDQAMLYQLARDAGAEIDPDMVWPKIVDELLKQFVQPTLIQPTFLTDYPIELTPLAKRSADDPLTVERFQLFVAGVFELCNAYTELNDPLDQYERFMAQVRQRDLGDDETMPIDLDYVEALMYGMPPTGGFGIGIDRMAMLLTNQQSIREVILFPPMRSKPDPAALPQEDVAAGGDASADGR